MGFSPELRKRITKMICSFSAIGTHINNMEGVQAILWCARHVAASTLFSIIGMGLVCTANTKNLINP